MRFTFFKTPKPRQFEYRPRFYDPDKEAREQRRRELLGDQAGEIPEGEYKPGNYIRQNMSSRGTSARQRNRQSAAKPIRLVIMIILLGLAVWWVLS